MKITLDLDQSKSAPLRGGLYMVGTPIGHLDDITLRALKTLSAVDVIVCEDTRVSSKLLSAYGLSKPLLSYHEHNADKMRPHIIQRLHEGQSLAFITDAGMPLVSDPGYKLVRSCFEEGLYVTVVPGPTASLSALCLSGLPPDRFFFQGFLPSKSSARRQVLQEIASIQSSLIIFEAPHRLTDMLQDAVQILGDRPACIAHEMTKLFEERIPGSLSELALRLADQPIKGEAVVVIEGDAPKPMDQEDLERLVRYALRSYSLKEAVSRITQKHTLPKKRVYDTALRLQREQGDAFDHESPFDP